MWLYRTSGDAEHPIVLYEYQPSRKKEHPKTFLSNFKGYLHTDGYDGYHKLPEEITVVGCLAHARRKWFDALKIMPKDKRAGTNVQRGVEYIDRLFALEKRFADLTADERFKKRQELSRPLLDEFLTWVEPLGGGSNMLLGKAVGYTLGQRKYLENYLLDGRLEISNNRAERSVKPFVMSRKNFLFANTPRGAKSGAIIFSLIETAKENGLSPYEYLTYIFQNAPNLDIRNNPAALAHLLPDCPDLPAHIRYPQAAAQKTSKLAWVEG
jgi:transposase